MCAKQYSMQKTTKMKVESIWIGSEEWAFGEWTPANDNTDVIVTLEDRSRWGATFFSYSNIISLVNKNKLTGECLSGKYFWASDMVLADEVSRERIEEIVEYLVIREPLEFQSIFTKLEEETNETCYN